MKSKKSKVRVHSKKVAKLPSLLAVRWLRLLTLVIVIGAVGYGGVRLTHFSFAASSGTVDFVTYDSTTHQECTAATRVNMRRFINPWFSTGPDHFYTIDQNFVNGANGYAEENHAAWYEYASQVSGTTPLYKSFSGDPPGGVDKHFYTTNWTQVQNAAAYSFAYQGVEGYIATSQQPGTIPLYHVYNTGTHDNVYSTDYNEVSGLLGNGAFTYYANDPANFITGYVWTNNGSSCSTVQDPIGMVNIVTNNCGSGTTIASSDQNHGHLKLTCPAGTNVFKSATRDGYIISPSTPHPAGSTFTVYAGQTTKFSIYMQKGSTPAPAPSPAPTPSPTPAPTGGTSTSSGGSTTASGSTSSSGSSTSTQKNGSVQVTTYVYHPDGSISRIPGVNVHIQAVGKATTDTAHNCTNYNETTASGGSAASNPDYAQVHFNDCWTNTGTQNYQLSYVQVPSGYSYRSFRILGPGGATFVGGGTSTTDGIAAQFPVKATQETQLAIWLTNNKEAALPNSSLKQVVTQSGVKFAPADNSDAAKKAADTLNTVAGNGDLPDPTDGDLPEVGYDDQPPSAPSNLKVTEDNAGGITLAWDAATGNPPGENVTYYVQRINKDESADDELDVADPTDQLHAADESDDIAYPATYIYSVYAEDDNGNDSDPVTAEFTTTKPSVNIDPSAATSEDDTGDNNLADLTTGTDGSSADDGEFPPDFQPYNVAVTVTDDSNNADLTIPQDAVSEPLSCDISDSSTTGADLLDEYGDPLGNIYTPECSDSQGDSVDDFSSNVDYSFDVDNSDFSDATLYGYDGTDWVEIPVDQVDDGTQAQSSAPDATVTKGTIAYASARKSTSSKNHKTTFTVRSKKLFAVTLVKGKGGSPVPVVVSTCLVVLLVAGVFFIRVLIRRRLENRLPAPSTDVDLMPIDPATVPHPQYTQPPNPESTHFPWVTPDDQQSQVVQPIKEQDK